MTENQNENIQTSEVGGANKGKAMLYTGIGLILLVGAGGFLFTKKDTKKLAQVNPTPSVEATATFNNTESENEELAEKEGGTELTENEQVSPAASTAPTGTAIAQSGAIQIEGGMYYFKPDVIKVKKGQSVKIVFTNVGGIHDFVIDKFEVQSKQINGGQSDTVEFTPDQTGSFEFYCSIGNHRQMGMKGTLIVE